MELRVDASTTNEKLKTFLSNGLPALPAAVRASAEGLRATFGAIDSFLKSKPRDPIEQARMLDTLREAVKTLEGLEVEGKNDAFQEAKRGARQALLEVERALSNNLTKYYGIESKAISKAVGAVKGNMTLVIGAVILIAIVIVGAGVPILLTYLKNKKKKGGAGVKIGVPLVKDLTYEVPSPVDRYTLSTTQDTFKQSNGVCTYTLAYNVGSLNPDRNTSTFVLARANIGAGISDANALSAAVMRMRLDHTANMMYLELRTREGTYCSFPVEDVPLYRWAVMHVVFNNTPNFKIAHVYIDGELVKLCHLFMCTGDLVSHDGNTVMFGKDMMINGSTASTNNDIVFKYFKYAAYTLQPDEIAYEAKSLLSSIHKAIAADLAKQNACTTGAKVNKT
jgi:hypothetical protein